MPRVVSGSAKGLILQAPRGNKTRPTSDKAKEALFSILSGRIQGTRFLDIFAGTGQIGIEALSRGADFAVFVDSGHESISCIKTNLQKSKMIPKAEVCGDDVFRFLKKYEAEKPFDIVYIDPPYSEAAEIFRKISAALSAENLISKDPVIILEHSSMTPPDDFVTNLKLKRCCKYGTVMLSFYERYDHGDEHCSAGGIDIK